MKSLAIFVHGFNSDPSCWDALTSLLESDPAVMASFDLMKFAYQSKVTFGWLNPISRLPEYGDIVKRFERFVEDSLTSAYAELYLVGHSQGGLIIQEWLVRQLNDGRGRQLRRVREVLMIATPTLGSNIAYEARRVLFGLVRNPQEARLRAFNSQVAETRRAIEKQVMNATTCDDRTCPIPIIAFYGTEDNVVLSASAEASFDLCVALNGNHTSIIRPGDQADERYVRVRNALLAPEGHKHVFEIESYETTVSIEPLTGDRQAYVARRRGASVVETSDNFGRIIRSVCFSRKNHCVDLFRYNYQTNSRGYMVATVDMQPREPGEAIPPNEAGADEISDFAQSGTQTTYKFTPRPGRVHTQTLEIWNGFNEGGRDVHFHTGNNIRCGRYTFRVDLSAYAASGWNIIEPQLFIHPWDTGEHEITEQRLPQNRISVSDATTSGVWTWSLPGFRGGIVDAVWDVKA